MSDHIRRQIGRLIKQHQFAQNRQYFTADDLAQQLGLPRPTIAEQLAIMKSDGLIQSSRPMSAMTGQGLVTIYLLTGKGAGWLEGQDSVRKGKVFISCGQATVEERALGEKVAARVGNLTSFDAYFAQNQSDLDGVTQNIFRALYESVGFIAIMHQRGHVKTLDRQIIRASIWVEQEIAIASFLRHVLGRQLHVRAYIQSGIALEGVREKIMLNAIPFTTDAEIENDLGGYLPTWGPLESVTGVGIAFRPTVQQRTPNAIVYLLEMLVANTSEDILSELAADLSFPKEFLSENTIFAREKKDRATETHRFFEVPHEQRQLFPGNELVILSVTYAIESQKADDAALDHDVQGNVYRRGKRVGQSTSTLRAIMKAVE